MYAVSQSVKVLRGQLEVHLDILVREDQGLANCINVPVGGVHHVGHAETEGLAFGWVGKRHAQHLQAHIVVTGLHVDHILRDREALGVVGITQDHSEDGIGWHINHVLKITGYHVVEAKEVLVPPIDAFRFFSIF